MCTSVNTFAVIALLGIAASALSASPTEFTVLQTDLSNIDPDGIGAPYQSSNSDVLWILQQSTNSYYGYNPAKQALTTQYSPLPSNTNNNDHIDQLYYDSRTDTIIAQMEVGLRGGVGPYYVNAYTPSTGELLWGNSSFHIHRNTYGGLGGVQNGVAVFMTHNNVYRLYGLAADSGEELWSKEENIVQVRCNPTSDVCVTVRYEQNRTRIKGYYARSGREAWVTYFGSTKVITFTDVVGKYIVFHGSSNIYRIDSATGTTMYITPRLSSASYHVRGPNLIHEDNSNTLRVFSVATGMMIIDESNVNNWFADYNAVVFVRNHNSGTTRDAHFHQASDGSLINVVSGLTIPQNTGIGWGSFIVGANYLVPTGLNHYQLTNGFTGQTTTHSNYANQFSPNIALYPGGTIMWSVSSILQFEVNNSTVPPTPTATSVPNPPPPTGTCGTHSTCNGCAQDPSGVCGWCATTKICEQGSFSGPSSGEPSCSSSHWIWYSSNC